MHGQFRSQSLDFVLPQDVVAEGLDTYLQLFTNLPCPLLSTLLQKLQPRTMDDEPPRIVLKPILAIAFRAAPHAFFQSTGHRLMASTKLSEQAWELLVRAYSLSQFDEPYFEGLCVLALYDFASEPAILCLCR